MNRFERRDARLPFRGEQFRATAVLIAEFAERHRARNATWGRIVTITSGGANGFPGRDLLRRSKAALESYTSRRRGSSAPRPSREHRVPARDRYGLENGEIRKIVVDTSPAPVTSDSRPKSPT